MSTGVLDISPGIGNSQQATPNSTAHPAIRAPPLTPSKSWPGVLSPVPSRGGFGAKINIVEVR